MHQLAELIAQNVASGLKRKSLTTCSRWACACRVMGRPFPGPWTFKYHPWLREMHDSEAVLNVGQKSAQAGFTETVLNITFHSIDVRGIDCLYVLPAKTPDASDFSASRFDPALELSSHLSRLFSDVKNIGHKRAGTTNLYIRGSRSRSGLKSVPVGLIVLDELDEMTQENIPLALERTAGQVEKAVWMVSTATIDNFGINSHFLQSTQNHFFFTCPHCGKQTELVFPDCLIITSNSIDDPKLKESHLVCKECKGVLPHETKSEWLATGKWVEAYSNRDAAGWHINQLYSSTVSPYDLAKAYLKAQFDRAAEQEFFNSKLGLPHVVDGARVTDEQIRSCIADYLNGTGAAHTGRLRTMGVDVGAWLHYEIDEWILPPSAGVDINITSKCRVVKHGKCRDFEELDKLMYDWRINQCVIDAQPERRKALEFANRFFGHVRICWYPNGISGKSIHKNDEENSVSVDRTSWLDLSLGRFRGGSIILPRDVDSEYRSHIKSLVRIYENDKNGNPIGKYVKGNEDDHYAHARNYSEIALPLALSLIQPRDISGVV